MGAGSCIKPGENTTTLTSIRFLGGGNWAMPGRKLGLSYLCGPLDLRAGEAVPASAAVSPFLKFP